MPWLMKAEPDSRVVKGKDVKFSVDDFERLGVSPWDGVRGHEARNIMRDRMKKGDKVLFYHSNCNAPGVFALAEVDREGYPDYTAWDPSHPYFDEKTDKENPIWFMVDVRFMQRLPHPPSLVLIKLLAGSAQLPEQVSYIGDKGFAAIKAMQLVNRGRLSVQPVTDDAYQAVVQLGTEGGWEKLAPTKKNKPKRDEAESEVQDEIEPAVKSKKRKSKPVQEESDAAPERKPEKRKSKLVHAEQAEAVPERRRSSRKSHG